MQNPALSKNLRAQAVVEFALVLPFLVLLAAGAIDLANGFTAYIALSNGAREGAAYAAYPPDNATGGALDSNICSRAKAGLPTTLQGATCTPNYPVVTGCPSGTRVARCPIRVTLSYSLTTLVGSVLGSNSFTVSPTVDMMVLQ